MYKQFCFIFQRYTLSNGYANLFAITSCLSQRYAHRNLISKRFLFKLLVSLIVNAFSDFHLCNGSIQTTAGL